MPEYMFLMHNDVSDSVDAPDWGPYLAALQSQGCFQGGSRIGGGVCLRKSGAVAPINDSLGGYIRVEASGLEHARQLLVGNPVFEAGGTVEIRELPRD